MKVIEGRLKAFVAELNKTFAFVIEVDRASINVNGTDINFPEIMQDGLFDGKTIAMCDLQEAFDAYCKSVNTFIDSQMNITKRKDSILFWRVYPIIEYNAGRSIDGWPVQQTGYTIYSRMGIAQ